MTRLAVDEALRRAAGYPHAVVSWLHDGGCPMSVAVSFRTRDGAVECDPAQPLPGPGRQVCVTFSHVRPRPGVGYDERRYVNVWGRTRIVDGRTVVDAETASGWDEAETSFFEYSERAVPRGRGYLDAIGARPRLGRGWLFFLATRLPFLTATIVPVALGGAVAAHHASFRWDLFGLTTLAACCVHLGLNIANDLFDDASGADAANVTPTPFSGGSRVLQYGLVSRGAMSAMCAGFYLAGTGIGSWLALTRWPWLFGIGAAGIAVSLAYTAPPLRLVHRGLGEPAVALGFGPLTTLGAYAVQAQGLSVEAMYASAPVALFIAMVLYVNEVPDRRGDAASGKRTLVVRWPRERVIAAYAVAVAAAYALVAAGPPLGLAPVWTLAALATVPMALKVFRGLRTAFDDPYALMPVMQTNIGLHLATGLLLVAGWVAARLV